MRDVPTIEEPVPVLDLSAEEIDELTAEVKALAAQRNAVILAHNYQVPEIQDLADFVGDSLGLARRAAATEAVVVMYVNTSAEVKAETDYCCTSANAVEVVEHVRLEHGDEVEILFGPDMWLGSYVERATGRRMNVWPGECHVHAAITQEDIDRRRTARPVCKYM